MTRLLIIGVSPLPVDRSRRHAAPGLRAWQFARALSRQGHDLCLVTLGERHGSVAGAGAPLRRVSLPAGDFTDAEQLQEIHDDFGPDAVITAGSYQPTVAAYLLRSDRPLWIDLPGDMMAEAQLRAAMDDEHSFMSDYLSILRRALLRGDHFSAISGAQRLSLVGQLGVAGRLGPGTLGRELVSVVPPAVEPAPRVTLRPRPDGVPPDAFVLLSSGGYNTWCDVETLVAGLEGAMAQDPGIHFVSAGGAVADHCVERYRRLQELVERSPHARNFHLLGWQWPEELGALYAASQLGINMDLQCYEAELGSRNRLLDWLRHGLPCLTTAGSELARQLCDAGAGWATPPGDPEQLTGRVLELAAEPEQLASAGATGRALVSDRFSPEETTRPLLRWAAAPRRAGDHDAPRPAWDRSPELLEAELARAEAQLRAVRGSLAFRGMRRAEDLADPVRRWLKGRKN